ncbi:hypothetical protein J437_LFUL015142 [Ladona fulva]|uniref:Uncharacterized protein n=1 Tax=Ladona fulva TaxID=123851 RepID=A0A8K0KKJ2_LADFU|nr:hypothetical protein J437_LFUL015142 [Ladona fulva]
MYYENCCLDKENIRTQSKGQMIAVEYLKRRRIKELFHFLQCIILSEEPDDPFQKMLQTIEQLISFRKENTEPPMLFSREHTDAVFASMDPLDTKTLLRQQFRLGMEAMGLTEHVSDDDAHLKREFALEKALRRQRELVKAMVTPAVFAGRICETNEKENLAEEK